MATMVILSVDLGVLQNLMFHHYVQYEKISTWPIGEYPEYHPLARPCLNPYKVYPISGRFGDYPTIPATPSHQKRTCKWDRTCYNLIPVVTKGYYMLLLGVVRRYEVGCASKMRRFKAILRQLRVFTLKDGVSWKRLLDVSLVDGFKSQTVVLVGSTFARRFQSEDLLTTNQRVFFFFAGHLRLAMLCLVHSQP